MHRRSRYLLVILLLLGVAVLRNVIFVGHVLPRMLIQPTPNEMANTFVAAITANNVKMAITLTDGTPKCVANMIRTFEWFDSRYPEFQADRIIWNQYWLPDDPSIEMIDVAFWDSNRFQDTSSVITLWSTYKLLGRRYTCGGNVGDDGVTNTD